MSAVPSVTPDAGPAVTEAPKTKSRRKGGAAPGTDRGFLLPTLFMLAFVVYFLMPLWWLLVASTKSIDDLFDSFGLWFANFNLIDNISDDVLAGRRRLLDVAAQHADVLDRQRGRRGAAGGHGRLRLREVPFRGKNLLFWIVLGSVMVPDDGAGDPDLPAVQQGRAHEQPASRSSCRRWSARSAST